MLPPQKKKIPSSPCINWKISSFSPRLFPASKRRILRHLESPNVDWWCNDPPRWRTWHDTLQPWCHTSRHDVYHHLHLQQQDNVLRHEPSLAENKMFLEIPCWGHNYNNGWPGWCYASYANLLNKGERLKYIRWRFQAFWWIFLWSLL